jgi:inosine-uridine nucleoside N-ribohydrolase
MLDVPPIPVACGRETPLGDAQPFPDAWRAGADSGNGLRLARPGFLTDSRAAEQVLVDVAAAEAGAGRTLTILTLGTLTNLAGAAALDPAFAGRVRVVSMLGAVGVAGNAAPGGEPNPTAEWNAHADPTAVRDVLAAGFDLTLVPLDATRDAPLTPALYANLGSDHAAGPADLVYELWSINSYMTAGGFYLWDPLAAAVVRDPSIVQGRPATLRVVEGSGLDGGRLVEDPAGAPVTVAIGADTDRFEALLLAALRIGGSRGSSFSPVATVAINVSPGQCDVTWLGPPRPGLVEVRLTLAGAMPGGAIVFFTKGVDWAELEAYAADPDPQKPPDVDTLAFPQLGAAGSTTSYATVGNGPLGIACVTGDPTAPKVQLRGPFPVEGATIRVTVGPGTCDVELDPPILPPGPVRLEVSGSGPEPGGVVVFTSSMAWTDIEARFSPPDLAHWFEFEQTPVVSAGFEPGESGSSVGEVAGGPLGVICTTVSGPVPTPPAQGGVPNMVLLRGPFDVAR